VPHSFEVCPYLDAKRIIGPLEFCLLRSRGTCSDAPHLDFEIWVPVAATRWGLIFEAWRNCWWAAVMTTLIHCASEAPNGEDNDKETV